MSTKSSLIRAAMCLLLLTTLYRPGAADQIKLSNALASRRQGTVNLTCKYSPSSQFTWPISARTGEISVEVPDIRYNPTFPPVCVAVAEGGSQVDVYRYNEDHRRCRKSCEVQLRDDGVYMFAPRHNSWRLLRRFQVLPQ